jgi:hypothetical protein
MTGEWWEWHRVSTHLRIPVLELRQRIGVREFQDWLYYLNETELKDRVKLEWYLAQLTAEVRRSWVAKPRDIKNADFILKFNETKPVEEERAERLKKSKSAWFGLVGLDPDNPKKPSKHASRRKPRKPLR